MTERVVNAREFAEIVRKHERYLKALPGGARAVICDADLSGLKVPTVDLRDAILSHVTLRHAVFGKADLSGLNCSRPIARARS